MQRTVAKNVRVPAATRTSSKAPLSLSDYIQTVYKISEENTVEAEEARRKLLDSNPELAQLAARVAMDSKDVQSRNKLAEGYLHAGLLWSAYHLFQESRSLMDNNFDAEIGLAQTWDKWKDYSMARQHAGAAVSINPQSAEAHEVAGRIHLHRNAPMDAVEEFKAAADIAPDKPSLLANLGYSYMLLGKLTDAKATLARALSLDPTLTEAHNNLGIVLAEMGDYQGSLAEMQKVGNPPVALNNLGAVLLSEKKSSEAAQVFQQALDADPNYKKAAENLAAARALTPPPAVVSLPSFGPAALAAKKPEDPKPAPQAPIQAAQVDPASTVGPAATVVETPKAAVLAASAATRTPTAATLKPIETPAKPVEISKSAVAPAPVETPKVAPTVQKQADAPRVEQTVIATANPKTSATKSDETAMKAVNSPMPIAAVISRVETPRPLKQVDKPAENTPVFAKPVEAPTKLETAKVPLAAAKGVESPNATTPESAVRPVTTAVAPAAAPATTTVAPKKVNPVSAHVEQASKVETQPGIEPRGAKAKTPTAASSTSSPEPKPAAVTPSNNEPPAPPATAPASMPSAPMNPMAIYAVLGVLGMGIMTWLSSRTLATARAKRTARRTL
jgi:tetratricopeptide (TPR) repeat protein